MRVKTSGYSGYKIIWVALWVIAIPYFFMCVLLAAQILLLGSVFCMTFWSSAYGMRSKDTRVPQLYLNHFGNLHPDLQEALSRPTSRPTKDLADTIKFWPTSKTVDLGGIPPLLITVTTKYRFTHIASLFASIQASGFSQRELWTFLRDEVETHIAISDADKTEFRRVMAIILRPSILRIALFPFMAGIAVTYVIKSKMYDYLLPGERIRGSRADRRIRKYAIEGLDIQERVAGTVGCYHVFKTMAAYRLLFDMDRNQF